MASKLANAAKWVLISLVAFCCPMMAFVAAEVVKLLTTLNLHGTKVTDAGVKELQEALPKCKVSR
jgi:hypothetical protein